jgi:hypothetical protein
MSRFFYAFRHCLDGLYHTLNLSGCPFAGFHYGPLTYYLTIQILENLGGAFQRYMMLLVEVHHLRFDPLPILHTLTHLFWKYSCIDLVAVRTFFDLCPMFGHFHLDWGNVKHLAPFMLAGFDRF